MYDSLFHQRRIDETIVCPGVHQDVNTWVNHVTTGDREVDLPRRARRGEGLAHQYSTVIGRLNPAGLRLR